MKDIAIRAFQSTQYFDVANARERQQSQHDREFAERRARVNNDIWLHDHTEAVDVPPVTKDRRRFWVTIGMIYVVGLVLLWVYAFSCAMPGCSK